MKIRPKEIFSRNAKMDSKTFWNDLKKRNPKQWKKLKKQFDDGRQIASVQSHNGLEISNEKELRYYLMEYVSRYLNYGPKSFPGSFNVLEPFFVFNHHNSIIQLMEDEESYNVSLIDFLEFVTESKFNLNDIDFYENIIEATIYHISFSNFNEYNFSESEGGSFLISGLSIIRQSNQISMLMQAGEKFDKNEAEKYFENEYKEFVKDRINPKKRALGLELDKENNPGVEFFEDNEDYWKHTVAILFDLEAKTIDIRYVARDERISFNVFTDDVIALGIEGNEEGNKRLEQQNRLLSNYSPVFDFAEYCLALPYFIFENEDKLIDVVYETSLHKLISGPLEKRKYQSVPGDLKIYAKSLYYLESDSLEINDGRELGRSDFKIEKSGYWKQLDQDENGQDKKGRTILGKTWVERTDSFLTSKKGATQIKKNKFYKNSEAGNVYVMRQPTLEDNIFKVGLTKRDVNKRRKELSNTSSPDMFYEIASFNTKDCRAAEKRIHKKLEIYRMSKRREFFRCDLRFILDACQSVVNEINNSDLK